MDSTGNSGAGKTPPIFVVGRFRSGTTALWSALRTLPELHCFFEPLHDNLLEYIAAAAPPDPTHRGVDEYFAEYEACRTRLAALHRPEFGVSRLCLAGGEAHEDLEAYLRALAEEAAPRRALFKLVRADYRLPWIRSRFPDSPIISIRRNPRDCWASIVQDLPASQRHDPSINTGYDLLVWAAQLAEHFDAISSLRYGHSYEVAYHLWRVSNLVADRYADLVVDFDHELQADPTKALRQILKTAGLDGRKLGRKMLERIVSCPRSADEEYGNSVDFEAIEAHCEERLKDSGLLSSIAEDCLKAESWPISQRSPSPFSESLGMEISRHRGELMRNRKAYLDSSLQAETQVEGLSRELEKRESVAGELREELAKRETVAGELQTALKKLRTDSAGEIEARDRELSKREWVAGGLVEALQKMRADSADEIEARDRELEKRQSVAEELLEELEKRETVAGELLEELEKRETVAGELLEELEKRETVAGELQTALKKLRADSTGEIETRDRELEKRKSVADELREELEKLRADSTGEIETRDRELEKRKSVADELREELEKLRADSTGEIETRDRELEKRKSVADELHEELGKLRADSTGEIEARDRELEKRESVARELQEELEKREEVGIALQDEVKKLESDAREQIEALEEAIRVKDDELRTLHDMVSKKRRLR